MIIFLAVKKRQEKCGTERNVGMLSPALVRNLCLHRSETSTVHSPRSSIFPFLLAAGWKRWASYGFAFLLSQGYYRAGYSLLRLLQPYEAARMFFEGLRLLQSTPDQIQVADFLVGIFTTMGSKLEPEGAFVHSFFPFLKNFKILLFYLKGSWGDNSRVFLCGWFM